MITASVMKELKIFAYKCFVSIFFKSVQGLIDAVKVWKFKKSNESLQSKFSAMNPGIFFIKCLGPCQRSMLERICEENERLLAVKTVYAKRSIIGIFQGPIYQPVSVTLN